RRVIEHPNIATGDSFANDHPHPLHGSVSASPFHHDLKDQLHGVARLKNTSQRQVRNLKGRGSLSMKLLAVHQLPAVYFGAGQSHRALPSRVSSRAYRL